MTKWTESTVAYLKRLACAGDKRAQALLRRTDRPGRLVRKSTWRMERRTKADQRIEARKQMRAEVWAWNINTTCGMGAWAGACDCGCGQAFKTTDSGELDHWVPLGQGGKDERENGWRLTGGPTGCHARKTGGLPPLGEGPTTWNERRRAYCERAGIPFVERRKAG